MSRLVVAMDTATEAIALGVARCDSDALTLLAGGYEVAPRQANSRLLRALVDMLGSCGLGVRDVGGVIVGRGPGSFTGVRIGVAAAKGLAQGLAAPLVGVGTLDAIASRFAEHDGLVGVVGDAMRGEVYPALFRVSRGRVERLGSDTVSGPDEAAAAWARNIDGPVVLTGNGLAKHAAAFTSALGDRAVLAEDELWWPNGSGLFGAFMEAGGEALLEDADPGAVLPVYTRLSDAEEAERARAGLAADAPPANGVAGGPVGTP